MSRVAAALFAAGVALATGIGPAHAAFPGTNGRLVFQQERPAGDHTQTDLWTIQPGGGGLRRLTATPFRNEFGPNWNAAGTRIAFWRTKAPFGFGSVWVMRGDGSAQQRLTRGFDARDPAWSPSGTRIVFTRGGAGFDLWTVSATGNNLTPLTKGPAEDFEPAWSPDGRRIAFTRGFEQGSPGHIAVLDLRSHTVTVLTHAGPGLMDHGVNWSPDGSRLVFERNRLATSRICTVPSRGGPVTCLTAAPDAFDVGPAYSPDGTRIAFGRNVGVSFADLWMMEADGSHQHVLRALPFSEGEPDWRPRYR
jgi:TolB protein